MDKESNTEVSKKNWDRITGKKKFMKKKVRGKSKSSEFINSSYLLH
jgi:hypothetical protein